MVMQIIVLHEQTTFDEVRGLSSKGIMRVCMSLLAKMMDLKGFCETVIGENHMKISQPDTL